VPLAKTCPVPKQRAKSVNRFTLKRKTGYKTSVANNEPKQTVFDETLIDYEGVRDRNKQTKTSITLFVFWILMHSLTKN
jgi:hypothetical protein